MELKDLRQLVDKLPVIIYRISIKPELKVEYVSKAIETYTGYKPEEFYNNRDLAYNIYHPDDLDYLNHIIKMEILDPVDVRWYRKDGTSHWMELQNSYIHDDEGKIIALEGVARILNYPRSRTAELTFNESLLNATQEITKVGGWKWDIASKSMYWTKECYRIHDLDPDLSLSERSELIIKSIECYNPEDRELVLQAFKDCIDNGIPYDLEFELHTYKGRDIWIRTSANPIYREGKIIQVIGNIVDITERKISDDKLRVNEERLRLANQATNSVVWDWDIIGDTQLWSEAGKEIYGYDDIIGSPQSAGWWLDKINPCDRERVENSFYAVVNSQDKNTWEDEYRFRRKDGSYSYIQDRGYLIRDSNSLPIRMIGAMHEISDRKREEILLRLQSDIMQNLSQISDLNQALDYLLSKAFEIEGIDSGGIYLIDPVNNNINMVVHANLSQAFVDSVSFFPADSKEMTNLRLGTYRYQNYQDIQQRPNPDVFNEGIRSYAVIPFLFEGKPVASLNLASHHYDEIPLETKLVLQALASNLGGVILRLRAEAEYKNSELRFNKLFDSMLEGFALHKVICNEDGKPVDYRFLLVNPAYERLTGLKAENIIGKRLLEIMPNTEKTWIDCFGKVALSGETMVVEDYSNELNKYFRSIAYSTEPGYFVVVIDDITDAHRIQEELIAAKDKAEESNRIKSAFLASINHELRTPLNHIMGFSQLIQCIDDLDEIKKYTNMIYNSGDALLQMIQDIFDLALADPNLQKAKPQKVDCYEFFNDAKIALEDVFRSSGKSDLLALAFKPDIEALATFIEFDPGKVMQILNNLFRNAVKFTHTGKIIFGFHLCENAIRYYVEDTGIGVPAEKTEIIFDFFRQGDESDTRLYSGVGIGLAISKRLADIIGAKISLVSELNRGSCFYLDVPATVYQREAINHSKALDLDCPDFSEKKILVADDDENSLIVLRRIVERTNARVLTAVNGKEALEIIMKDKNIDLVLMDKKMPIMDVGSHYQDQNTTSSASCFRHLCKRKSHLGRQRRRPNL